MATISDHPRFKLARALLTGQGGEGDIKSEGNPAAAIDIFAALLEECRSKGDKSLNAALCQFEYGNALFRAAARRTPMDGDANAKQDEESDKKPAAKNDVMASAAMKRSAGVTKPSPNKRAKTDDSSDVNNISSAQDARSESAQSDGETSNNTEDDEDIELAYEMMDTSWRILLSHITNGKENSDGGDDQQQKWALEQIPRVIRCIGDLYFFQQEYANAVDCYLRAMQYREEAWDKLKQQSNGNGSDSTDGMLTLEHLQCQRYLVEICALVAESLLACPAGEDVVCYLDDDSENGGDAKDDNESSAAASATGSNGNTLSKESRKGTVLAKAKDRLDYAQSHYELAREGLEEILCRYGKMAAANIDVGNEKEDIGYLVMSVVDVGQTIQND